MRNPIVNATVWKHKCILNDLRTITKRDLSVTIKEVTPENIERAERCSFLFYPYVRKKETKIDLLGFIHYT